MQNQSTEEKEPPKLRIILPLVAVILLLTGIIAMINLSKSPYTPMTTPELSESFAGYISKFKNRDHYALFISHKKVMLPAAATWSDSLQGLEGSDQVSAVKLTYDIPVLINLTGDWLFILKDTLFQAQVPFPSFGEAILDSASLEVSFKSEITDDKKSLIKNALKETLASYQITIDPALQTTLEQESQNAVQDFLALWLKTTYKDLPDFKYQISFTGSKNSGSSDEP